MHCKSSKLIRVSTSGQLAVPFRFFGAFGKGVASCERMSSLFILARCGEQDYEKRDLLGKRTAAALSRCRADIKILLVFIVIDLAAGVRPLSSEFVAGRRSPLRSEVPRAASSAIRPGYSHSFAELTDKLNSKQRIIRLAMIFVCSIISNSRLLGLMTEDRLV